MKNFRNEVWSAEKSSEIVPHSEYFEIISGEKLLHKFEPFLVHTIRYIGLPYSVKFWFEINNREYGNWLLYDPSGFVPVIPALFFNGEVYLCFKNFHSAFSIALDGERIRPL